MAAQAVFELFLDREVHFLHRFILFLHHCKRVFEFFVFAFVDILDDRDFFDGFLVLLILQTVQRHYFFDFAVDPLQGEGSESVVLCLFGRESWLGEVWNDALLHFIIKI